MESQVTSRKKGHLFLVIDSPQFKQNQNADRSLFGQSQANNTVVQFPLVLFFMSAAWANKKLDLES